MLEDEELNSTGAGETVNEHGIKIIWLDDDALKETSYDRQSIIGIFQEICGDNYHCFNSADFFLEKITEIVKSKERIVKIIIMSGKFGNIIFDKNMLPPALLREISTIFIFCKEYDKYKYLLARCRKISAICTDEHSLKDVIENELHSFPNFIMTDHHLQPLINIGKNSNKFNSYKKFIDCLKNFENITNSRKDMVDHCKRHYQNNKSEMDKINEFLFSYESKEAIKWYTRDSFLYRSVNKALRSADMKEMVIFRPYIRDLCEQLEQLHQQNDTKKSITVFRGCGDMSSRLFNEIKRSIGSLVSFNGFLSTTTNYEVASIYAGYSVEEDKSIIFEIRAEYGSKNVVFADISRISHIPDEGEILFSLCSVFKIDSIVEDEINHLWKIIMVAKDENTLDSSNDINQEREANVCLERDLRDQEMQPIYNDESDPVRNSTETSEYRIDYPKRYYACKLVVIASAAVVIITLIVVGIIYRTSIKSQQQMSSSNNCKYQLYYVQDRERYLIFT